MSDSRPTVALVTLGCGRNEVDSDQVAGSLAHAGFILSDDPSAADCVLVNTCTFIEPARTESIETILDVCDLRADRAVVVIGCMAAHYGHELQAELPEVAAVVGFDAYPRLPEIVRAAIAGWRTPACANWCV